MNRKRLEEKSLSNRTPTVNRYAPRHHSIRITAVLIKCTQKTEWQPMGIKSARNDIRCTITSLHCYELRCNFFDFQCFSQWKAVDLAAATAASCWNWTCVLLFDASSQFKFDAWARKHPRSMWTTKKRIHIFHRTMKTGKSKFIKNILSMGMKCIESQRSNECGWCYLSSSLHLNATNLCQ